MASKTFGVQLEAFQHCIHAVPPCVVPDVLREVNGVGVFGGSRAQPGFCTGFANKGHIESVAIMRNKDVISDEPGEISERSTNGGGVLNMGVTNSRVGGDKGRYRIARINKGGKRLCRQDPSFRNPQSGNLYYVIGVWG